MSLFRESAESLRPPGLYRVQHILDEFDRIEEAEKLGRPVEELDNFAIPVAADPIVADKLSDAWRDVDRPDGVEKLASEAQDYLAKLGLSD